MLSFSGDQMIDCGNQQLASDAFTTNGMRDKIANFSYGIAADIDPLAGMFAGKMRDEP